MSLPEDNDANIKEDSVIEPKQTAKDVSSVKESDMSEYDESNEEKEKESFYKSMFKDVLYESDNIFEIPNLLQFTKSDGFRGIYKNVA